MFTEAQLAKIMACPISRAVRWAPHLTRAMHREGITTGRRAAHFLAEIGHESLGLLRVEESLNYSAGRLLDVFPRYFTRETAAAFARQPERIAERVYGGRNGNRPEGSGDGWKYRGRTPIQLTGRGNYGAMQARLGLPLLEMPALALEPEHGAAIAAAWWRDNGLNAIADTDDVLAVGRRINLGTTRTTRLPNGLSDRVERTRRAKQVLGVR